ncbi:serine hydrolase domain-containing protein [Hyphococcus lacteus]|uniref:Serine hydrolase domain-containing protein n=1 Tax=Hyphococcus lacteus TaxID=3143536 RepID=A0ABV3Z5E5_9PROT
MRLSVFGVLAWLIFGAGASAQVPDAAPSVPVDEVPMMAFEPTREEAVLEAYIDGVVAAYRRDNHIPAVSLSVVKDGKILFAKGYGYTDEDTKTLASGQETLFRIGSVSKTFTWVSIMILHERGMVDLDTDVNQYLKGIEIPAAFDAPVTLNDLMSHSAGFEDSFAVYTFSDGNEESLTEALKNTMPKRVYAPGARVSYSNWGAALAAKIVEDVSGMQYENFVAQEIFDPLVMQRTTLDGPSKMDTGLAENLAKGYRYEAGTYVNGEYMELGPFTSAGGVSSTADDMAQWMLVLLGRGNHNGVQLMTPETYAKMFAAVPDKPAMVNGFMTQSYHGVQTVGHAGATAQFLTNMMLVPDLDIGIYVSQNTGGARGLVMGLSDLVLDHMVGDSFDRPPSDDPAFEEAAAAYAGSYLSNRRSFTQFEKLFAAANVSVVAPANGGALTVSSGPDVSRYAPVPGVADTFEDSNGNRIVFARNEGGEVTHFVDQSGVHSNERVSLFGSPGFLNMTISLAAFFGLTTWLGAWRRQGRPVIHAATGGLINKFDLLAAVTVFGFVGAAAGLGIALSSVEILSSYPPLVVTLLRVLGYGLFVIALIAIGSLWPTWRQSGFSIWRKLHHSAFALSLGTLAVALIIWNVIFTGTA